MSEVLQALHGSLAVCWSCLVGQRLAGQHVKLLCLLQLGMLGPMGLTAAGKHKFGISQHMAAKGMIVPAQLWHVNCARTWSTAAGCAWLVWASLDASAFITSLSWSLAVWFCPMTSAPLDPLSPKAHTTPAFACCKTSLTKCCTACAVGRQLGAKI